MVGLVSFESLWGQGVGIPENCQNVNVLIVNKVSRLLFQYVELLIMGVAMPSTPTPPSGSTPGSLKQCHVATVVVLTFDGPEPLARKQSYSSFSKQLEINKRLGQ